MKPAENIYLDKFSEWLIIKGNTTTTAHSFCKTAKRFIDWLEIENIGAENVSYNDVLAYINYQKQKGNKQRTLQVYTNVIKHFYNCLQQDGEVNENPASNVVIKGIRRKELIEIFTSEELEVIYKSLPPVLESKEAGFSGGKPPSGAWGRNKIVLGLIINQGIRTEELGKLELQDLQLREGKINIQRSRRAEGRLLKLEAHQVYDLLDYVNGTRKEILAATQKKTNLVFVSMGTSLEFRGLLAKLAQALRKANPRLKNIQQLRTSVISNWLKIHNLRRTQYMAGHRFVSSTEAYKANNIDELQDDITKYHPIG